MYKRQVEGNGQHELVQALVGVQHAASGVVTLNGVDIVGRSPRQVRDAGLSTIPADRRSEGTVGAMSLTENFALTSVARGRYRRRGLLDRRAMSTDTAHAVEAYDVRPGRISAPASSLSGGNMQKLVIAREIAAEPRCMVAVSPCLLYTSPSPRD